MTTVSYNFWPVEKQLLVLVYVSSIRGIICIFGLNQHVFLFLCSLYYIHLTKKVICQYVDTKTVSDVSVQFQFFIFNVTANKNNI